MLRLLAGTYRLQTREIVLKNSPSSPFAILYQVPNACLFPSSRHIVSKNIFYRNKVVKNKTFDEIDLQLLVQSTWISNYSVGCCSWLLSFWWSVTIMAVKRKPSWTDAQLKATMNDVHGGSSMHFCCSCSAAMYSFPGNSLHDHLIDWEKHKEVWRTSASTTMHTKLRKRL